MVKALINISDEANRVLNIVKAQYGLKNKSEAIEWLAKWYERTFIEPELWYENVEMNKSGNRKSGEG